MEVRGRMGNKPISKLGIIRLLAVGVIVISHLILLQSGRVMTRPETYQHSILNLIAIVVIVLTKGGKKFGEG